MRVLFQTRRSPAASALRRRAIVAAAVFGVAASTLSVLGPVAGSHADEGSGEVAQVAAPAEPVAKKSAPPAAKKAVKPKASKAAARKKAAAHRKWRKNWKPTPGAKFNTPRVDNGRQFRLERQIVDAINNAAPRSTIRMSMFSFDRKAVSDALINARRYRKVRVQVIVNGHEFPGAQKDMQRAFKNNRQKPSFFYQCKASCRGQGDVNHSKFITFSQTGKAKHVVMVGSLNMKLNGAVNQFNDLLTVNYNRKLYFSLTKVFREMARDKHAKPSRRLMPIDNKFLLDVMPFPRKRWATKKTEWRPERDPIVQFLKPIRCKGARTNSGRTIVRVDMHAWDGERGTMLAKKFRDLHAAGCDVKVMVGFAGRNVRQVFASGTKRGRMPARSTGFDTDGDMEIDLYSHAKILTVNGNYNGIPNRKMVVTGSANHQNGGQYGDEIFLRVFDPRIYRQYADNWGRMWRHHTHGFHFGRTMVAGRGINGRPVSVPILWDGLGIDSDEWRDK